MNFAAQYKKIKSRLISTDRDISKAEYELAQRYMAVFGSVVGRQVLEHMLSELHFFDETTGPEEEILRNYARRILAIMGVWRPVNAESLVNGLMNINWRKPFLPEDDNE